MNPQLFLQRALAVIVLPVFSAIFVVVLALAPFTGSRIWRVGAHVVNNLFFVSLQLPRVLKEMWLERRAAPPHRRSAWPMVFLASTVGLPLIAVLLLLDDYPHQN